MPFFYLYLSYLHLTLDILHIFVYLLSSLCPLGFQHLLFRFFLMHLFLLFVLFLLLFLLLYFIFLLFISLSSLLLLFHQLNHIYSGFLFCNFLVRLDFCCHIIKVFDIFDGFIDIINLFYQFLFLFISL